MHRAAVRHVLEVLEPYSTENGGPLKIQHVSFVEGRGNIIVEYPGQDTGASGVISFVGAHMDVVTANPELWEFDPFTLTRDGDQLRGRGTTDCLGHVALLAELFRQLGEKRPPVKKSVVGVWIANEENSKVTLWLRAGCGAAKYRQAVLHMWLHNTVLWTAS
jgi:acetylornithine deacetylase